jgi:hypothetical protein|nr:MAG TPA: Rho termination factor, N-terminal domain [Caudoviricetes sp.]
MVCYEKDGVTMIVNESMGRIFESCGYQKVENSSAAPLSAEIPNNVPEPTDNPVETENKEDQRKYSRSEITRMSAADLKKLAKNLGIEVTEESTGKALKGQILEKLGL